MLSNLFVSYSREDEITVKILTEILRIKEGTIFFDKDSIKPGSKWDETILSAIDACDKLVLFWCCHSKQSKPVKVEYTYALSKNKIIVPVLLDGTRLPKVLAKVQWIDAKDIARYIHPNMNMLKRAHTFEQIKPIIPKVDNYEVWELFMNTISPDLDYIPVDILSLDYKDLGLFGKLAMEIKKIISPGSTANGNG